MGPPTSSKAKKVNNSGNKPGNNNDISNQAPPAGAKKRIDKSNNKKGNVTVKSSKAQSVNVNVSPSEPETSTQSSPTKIPSQPIARFDEFASRAKELKTEILDALAKQAMQQDEFAAAGEPVQIARLKEDVLNLSAINGFPTQVNQKPEDCAENQNETNRDNNEPSTSDTKADETPMSFKSDDRLIQAIDDHIEVGRNKKELPNTKKNSHKKDGSRDKTKATTASHATEDNHEISAPMGSDGFEPLEAKLDKDSKYLALISSLQKSLGNTVPDIFQPICKKLIELSEENNHLRSEFQTSTSNYEKLLSVKQKLENLCRELQKSNNAIRIESLELIKTEQAKAKEQTNKIQSTLSGVIKLFDENQQRNMTLRQENQELQSKLKSLLYHCDNWEKSVETTLKQRDIENRLVKTELAKANLLKNEEKEKFLSEKQELLRILSMMQEQQQKIESQEAKLRADLSNYASKYDECQAIFSKGMSQFKAESQRMLKQLDQSKQDYRALLAKYEATAKKTKQLLLDKQSYEKTIALSNKKVEALEKLCRALRNQSEIDLKASRFPSENKESADSPEQLMGNKCANDTDPETPNDESEKKGGIQDHVESNNREIKNTKKVSFAPQESI